jgi:Na+-translocating ferredoxin:NAD+ oxidoreductase RnfD subunit
VTPTGPTSLATTAPVAVPTHRTDVTETPVRRGLALGRHARDPRIWVLVILAAYLGMGILFLGFNRSLPQIAVTCACAVGLEYVLAWAFRGERRFPLSALITSLGLSLLLNYSHTVSLAFFPVLFAIGGKFLLTLKGRHVFNPALFGVVASILFSDNLITPSPAYQWNGIESMALFIMMPGLLLVVPGVGRLPIALSFLVTFTVQTFLRAWVMRHHLPFETLFLGTLTSPAFFLFTFFMITDPATSPKPVKTQIKVGAAIATCDLAFHLVQSYYTFFFAALTVATSRFAWGHYRAWRDSGLTLCAHARNAFIVSGYWRRLAVLGPAMIAAAVFVARPGLALLGDVDPELRFEAVAPADVGIAPVMGDVYTRVDPRIQHVIKWIFSVGDAVAVGDVDDDGQEDLFLTLPLKADRDRASLYLSRGAFRFERFEIPALAARSAKPEAFGIPTNALFVDYDNDKDLDLLVVYAFGTPLLLRSELAQSGELAFTDVTEKAGLAVYTNAVTADFADLDQDGLVDLIIGNTLKTHLSGYDQPTELNLFHLPAPAYEGDRRMFRFMHESWHQADNGGLNEIFLQRPDHTFARQDQKAWGFAATRWSLAIGSADFNKDGWPDLYVANDFGPDDLYLNVGGKRFTSVKGSMFGSIGRDTYKGMNASIADFDRNGYPDVYVSNVHHALQAEGSLLWLVGPGRSADAETAGVAVPRFEDQATELGALNENRFGWGAAAADLNNDGWVDLIQANGMVDDSVDKLYDRCPDYWYVNEKLARSSPAIHGYADSWGDIRGMCIYGKERNRVYLNRGSGMRPRFVDVAATTGLTEATNSRGVAAVDLDHDGDQDVIVTHMFAPPTIYRNELDAPGRAWLSVRLLSELSGCNASALGTVARIDYLDPDGRPQTQVQTVQAATGFLAQSSAWLHFGVETEARSARLSVQWCGRGEAESFDLQLGGRYTVTATADGGTVR